ncbi:hypothetical protein ACQKP3_20850 [Vibrio sp. DNB22_10_4]
MLRGCLSTKDLTLCHELSEAKLMRSGQRWSRQNKTADSTVLFCRQNNINQQAFYRQRNRLESHHTTDEFIKVEPATIEDTPTTASRSLPTIELTVGVVSLILPEHASPQWVAELIREVNQ